MCGGKADVGACSSLEQQGTDVTAGAGQELPVFAGGTPASGVYVLTKLECFGDFPADLRVRREIIQLVGSRFDQVFVLSATGEVKGSRATFSREPARNASWQAVDPEQVAQHETCRLHKNDDTEHVDQAGDEGRGAGGGVEADALEPDG